MEEIWLEKLQYAQNVCEQKQVVPVLHLSKTVAGSPSQNAGQKWHLSKAVYNIMKLTGVETQFQS